MEFLLATLAKRRKDNTFRFSLAKICTNREEGEYTMEPKKIVYYQDELTDEFSEAKIAPRKIDENYHYFHGKTWDLISLIVQNVLSMPIKLLYQKCKFHLKYVGKEKLKTCKHQGYFIYGNHTQPFADTFIPSVANYPHRNFFIVNPANVSMPGMHTLVEMLGAIPIPDNLGGMKHFYRAVEEKIQKNYSVTIYPEAHIWPYYVGIRPFTAVSFQYPVKFDCPVFCITNTYHERKGKSGKVDIVSFIDGPFFPDKNLKPKERQQALRDVVYETMCNRSRESDVEVIRYVKL